jgi:poly(A) polymerase
MKLEYVDSLVMAHPFIKGFDQEVYCLTEEEVRAVAEGELSPAVLKRKKEDYEGKDGRVVYTTTFYIGLAVGPKQRKLSIHRVSYIFFADTRLPSAGQQGPRKLDISYPTNEFVKMVKTWDKYDPATMGVVVLNIKRCVCQSGICYHSAFKQSPDRLSPTTCLARVKSRSPPSNDQTRR